MDVPAGFTNLAPALGCRIVSSEKSADSLLVGI